MGHGLIVGLQCATLVVLAGIIGGGIWAFRKIRKWKEDLERKFKAARAVFESV